MSLKDNQGITKSRPKKNKSFFSKFLYFLKVAFGASIFSYSFIHADDVIKYIKSNINVQLITQHPSGGLVLYLKVAFAMSLIVLFPLLFYEIIRYVKPALYPEEKKMLPRLYKLTALISVLFILGVCFGVFVVFNLIMPFLVKFNDFVGVTNIWDVNTTVMFVILSCFHAGLIFQTPILIYYLLEWKVINIENISQIRKVIIVGGLLLSAFITPPDVFSQIIFGFPIWFLFEMSVLTWRIKHGRRR